jgi:hypothetical protein
MIIITSIVSGKINLQGAFEIALLQEKLTDIMTASGISKAKRIDILFRISMKTAQCK